MAFINELKTNPIRTLKTSILCFLFIGLGIFVAVLGPALLDLQLLAGTTLQKAAYILPARSLGYAAGSVLGGVIGDKIEHQIVLIVSLIASIVTMICFPLFPNINIMYGLILLAGFANGSIDTVGNCWIIHLWGKENPPFMQVLHFMFGLGAFIAPFLVEPFLLNNEADLNSNKLIGLNMANNTNSSQLESTPIQTTANLMIHWPFMIAAIFYSFVLILFIIVKIRFPENPIHPSRWQKSEAELDEMAKKDKLSLRNPLTGRFRMIVIIIATFTMHAYVGLEISFGSLLSPFAVKSNLQMSKSEGSFLTSSYWATYTFLRIFSLIAIIYFAPRTLLLVNFGIIMICNFILLPFANDHRWALWLGSSLMGLGCSSVFATVFAFLEQLTPVTARITAGFLVAACAGELIIPVVVSKYIEKWPPIFLWTVFTYSTTSFIGILVLLYIQYSLLKNQEETGLRSYSKEMSNISHNYKGNESPISTISKQLTLRKNEDYQNNNHQRI